MYTGERQSSVVIGDGNLNSNTFPTPDFKENVTVQVGLGYSFDMGNAKWRINANIYNLFDNTEDVTYAEYVNEVGETVTRRSRAFYAPRTIRVAASVDF